MFDSGSASIDILTNIDLLRNARAPIEMRRQAANYLATNPNPVALPVIIKALDDPDFDIRKAALNACVHFKSPLMVDPLIKVLRERTFSEREDAINILGQLADPRALQPIADALLYSDWMSIRSAAATALGKMRFSEAVPSLLEALQDFEAPVRASAAEALGDIRDARAIDSLIKLMSSEKGWNLRHVSNALAKIGNPAIQPLIDILANEEQDQGVRELATETLGEIIVNLKDIDRDEETVKQTVELLINELPRREIGIRSHIARGALTRMSVVVSDHLIHAFSHGNAEIRDQLAYILGDSKDLNLTEKLVSALHSPNEQIAAGAARVLYFRGVNPRDHGYTGSL